MVDDEVIGQILRNYRHLMTESERRADRAFFLSAQPGKADGAERSVEVARALADDPQASELFQQGRRLFLNALARRIVAEHGRLLPKCGQCGGVLKSPSPKRCFSCAPPQAIIPAGELAQRKPPAQHD